MAKTVTVLMTTKDRVRKFRKAIISINNQVHKADKFIYTDNNTNWRKRIIKKLLCTIYLDIPWEARYSKATPGVCRDEMIRMADTEYYTFLDDDDQLHPKFLSMLDYAPADEDMYVCTYDDKFSIGSGIVTRIVNIEHLPATWEKYKVHTSTKVYMDNGEKIIKRSLYLGLEDEFIYKEYIYDDTVPVSVMAMRTKSVLRFADCMYKMDRGNDSLLVNAVGHNTNTKHLLARLELLVTAVDKKDNRQIKFFNKLLKLNIAYAGSRLDADPWQLLRFNNLKLAEIKLENQLVQNK